MDLMQVTWLACDLKSGLIRGELPLTMDKIRRVIAREETASWPLPVDDRACPDDWADMTVPGRDMIVLCLDDEPVIAWAITERVGGSGGPTLSGPTLEHTLARANVLTLEGEADEGMICSFVAGGGLIGFGFTADWEETGVAGYADYSSDEDVTCLSALTDRMRADAAPEWRIRLERSGARILKVFELRPRLGRVLPDVVFELDSAGRGNVAEYEHRTSYGPEGGATVVRAVSDGSGLARPMSSVHRSPLLDAGWPEWEARPVFPNILESDDPDAELERLARAALRQREFGTTTYRVVGDANAPRLGLDWREGDSVTIDIRPQGKRDPLGIQGVMRVLGWELHPASGQVTLIAWEEDATS